MTQPTHRPRRHSIEPTYDSRETGPRYHISSTINDKPVDKRTPLSDPFVRYTLAIHWWDALRAILTRGHLDVEVRVDGDKGIVDDVLELDINTLLPNSTRRYEFHAAVLNPDLDG